MDYFLDVELDLDECARAHGLQKDFESDDSDSGRSELDEKYDQNRLEIEDDYEGHTKLIKADFSRLTLVDDSSENDDFEEIGGRGAHKNNKPRNRFISYAMAVAGTSTSNQFEALKRTSDEEEIADNVELDSTTDGATSVIDADDTSHLPIDDGWLTVSYKKSSKITVSERIDCNRNALLSKPLDSKDNTVHQNMSQKPQIHQKKKPTDKQRTTDSNQPAINQKKQHTKNEQQNILKKSRINQKNKHTETVQQKYSDQPTTNRKKKLTKKQQQKVSNKTQVSKKVKEPENFSHVKLPHRVDKKEHKHAEVAAGKELDVYLQQEETNKKPLEQHELFTCGQCVDFINNEKERYSEDTLDFFTSEHEMSKELARRIWARSRIKQEEKRRGWIEKKIRYFFKSIFHFFLTLFGCKGYHNGVYQMQYILEPLALLALSELEACLVPNRYTLQSLIVDID